MYLYCVGFVLFLYKLARARFCCTLYIRLHLILKFIFISRFESRLVWFSCCFISIGDILLVARGYSSLVVSGI
jgi:hypothetical protein